MTYVKVSTLIGKMKLQNLTPEIDTDKARVYQPDINRPALQLAGFFEHFSHERIQIIGNVEYYYSKEMDREERLQRFEKIFESQIPCLIYARNLQPGEDVLAIARKYSVPVLSSDKITSDLMAEIIRWMKVQLAPSISIHGVLVDVYGEGVLIMGESGIGKSEAALELLKRGHRLVADDVVSIRKVSDDTLVGSAPDVTRHLIELRGIGIIDVKTLFGVEHVKNTQAINMVIKLEDWNKDKEYDRLGLEDQYTEFLGNKVVCHNIPIRPGRNLAIIVESAAINYRQKRMGYNAAQELYKRVQENFNKKKDDDDEEADRSMYDAIY
ncbi:MAG: HPr(Ser) kinase/phosphatase [Lachnospiraceae bacterium]|nr:HPr(Ser) kinase/phosphatase [Lachnospiraceae bacterium]